MIFQSNILGVRSHMRSSKFNTNFIIFEDSGESNHRASNQ